MKIYVCKEFDYMAQEYVIRKVTADKSVADEWSHNYFSYYVSEFDLEDYLEGSVE